jgi:hypothetical protein
MRVAHENFFHNLAIVGAVAVALVLLVWVVRRPAGLALAIAVPCAFTGAFIGLTATRGTPLTGEERVHGALVITGMLSAWLLPAAGVVAALRRRAAPRLIQAAAGALVVGVAYVATRAAVG